MTRHCDSLTQARHARPRHAPLGYPIVGYPMVNVCDEPAFARTASKI
jgi:hypothetical protein